MKKHILCVDPGCFDTAYVVWDGEKLLDKNKISNEELRDKIPNILLGRNEKVSEVIIEMVSSYAMQVGQTIFDSCVFVGILKQQCETLGVPVHLIFRKSIKLHHNHSLRGVNDGAVNGVLKQKYGEDNTIKKPNLIYWNEEVEKNGGAKWMNGDMWAAFSIATYWTEPKDSPVRNPKEMEINKLAPFLLKTIES